MKRCALSLGGAVRKLFAGNFHLQFCAHLEKILAECGLS
jgi:hypothetical protein